MVHWSVSLYCLSFAALFVMLQRKKGCANPLNFCQRFGTLLFAAFSKGCKVFLVRCATVPLLSNRYILAHPYLWVGVDAVLLWVATPPTPQRGQAENITTPTREIAYFSIKKRGQK